MFTEYADCFCWSCDACGLEAEFPRSRDFYECKDQLKARGWRITRHDREGWLHRCAKCVRAEAAEVVNILDRVPGGRTK
jgi:hypothetical protein